MGRSSFLRHAAVYGASHLLVYAGSFLLLPLYVRCLSEGEYGLLDVFNRVGEVLILCLLYNGLRQALLAFHNQSQSEAERRAVVGSALVVTLGLLVGGGAVFLLLAGPIGQLLQADSPGLLRLAACSVAAEAFALMLLALAQARVESVFFAVVSVVQFAIRVGLSILFVAGLGWDVEGVLIASLVASGLVTVWLLARECRRGLGFDRGQVWAMTRFALPFVPAGLGAFLLNSGDRFFLLQYAGPDEVGVYALGYKLALVVKLFSRRPLYMVWSAQMYDAARQPDAPVVFGRVFTRVLAAYLLVGLGLCVVAEEVVQVLAKGGYAGAAAIIPPVVLAYFFLSAADLMDAAFYVTRQTARKSAITLASTAVVLLLYALLIPIRGGLGAAWATLGGFTFQAGLTLLLTRRIFPVRYEWGRVGLGLASALLLWAVSRLVPVGLAWVALKLALALSWPVLLWLTGLVTPEEKAHILSRLRPLVALLRPAPRWNGDAPAPAG